MLFPHELSGLFFPSGARSVSSGQKLLLLVRRSPLNAACQPPLAVAPVARHFAAAPAAQFFCARFVELRCRVWKLALGSGSWVGGIEIETFDELCFKKIYVLKSLHPKP